MATIYKVDCPNRKPLFEGVQGENEARSIQFDITEWVEELGAGAVTATAKRPTDAQPYPVTIEQDGGNIVTWKPTSTDTAFEGVGSFQLEYTVDDVLAKTCIWSTQIAPSLDPAGDPPDPYDNWLASMREVAAAAQQSANDSAASAQQAAGEVTNAQTEVKSAEAWAVGTKGGVDVPSTDETYHNNAKYWAEKSNENQYGAYITKSASGSIASFSDGADGIPMKSLKVAIVPKQAGSGDPSPSNVRLITGTSTANVFVTGVNIWDEDWESYGSSQIKNKTIIPCKENTQYYIKCTTAGVSLYFKGANNESLGSFNGNNEVFTTPSGCVGFWLYAGGGYGATYDNDISINYPSTDHEYHPHNPNMTTTSVPLGQTVYGGEVDVDTGVLTITKYMKTADGTEPDSAYTLAPSGNMVGLYMGVPAVTDSGISNAFKHAVKSWVAFTEGEFEMAGNIAYFYVPAGRTIANAKAYIAQLGGVQFVGDLRTPTTVQLTPAQVATLLGTNNVWSDAGDVEVEYRADPTLAYAELQALILENN